MVGNDDFERNRPGAGSLFRSPLAGVRIPTTVGIDSLIQPLPESMLSRPAMNRRFQLAMKASRACKRPEGFVFCADL